jgi:hypothetical protein
LLPVILPETNVLPVAHKLVGSVFVGTVVAVTSHAGTPPVTASVALHVTVFGLVPQVQL